MENSNGPNTARIVVCILRVSFFPFLWLTLLMSSFYRSLNALFRLSMQVLEITWSACLWSGLLAFDVKNVWLCFVLLFLYLGYFLYTRFIIKLWMKLWKISSVLIYLLLWPNVGSDISKINATVRKLGGCYFKRKL